VMDATAIAFIAWLLVAAFFCGLICCVVVEYNRYRKDS
jgi:hypothetical protein